MRNFHIKSILLGIGIGAVLTSIIGMIYAAGLPQTSVMSDMQIISKAKQLGMVEGNILDGFANEDDIEKDKSAGEDNNSTDKNMDNGEGMITIKVKDGDTLAEVAGKLVDSGLVDDKSAFVKKLEEMDMDSSINVGEFQIKKGMDYSDIIEILTKDS